MEGMHYESLSLLTFPYSLLTIDFSPLTIPPHSLPASLISSDSICCRMCRMIFCFT